MSRSFWYRLVLMVPLLGTLAATAAGAAVIASGETRNGNLAGGNGRVESWTFAGAAGDRVVITTALYGGSVQPEIYLYEAGGGTLIASSVGPFSSHRLSHQLPGDGPYTITVQDYNLNGDGAYTIALANLSGPLTSATDADGGPIASGQTVAGTIYGYSDTDIFQFDGTAGERIIVTVDGVEPQPELYLFPPAGGPLEVSHEGNLGTRRLDWQLLATGTYTILVSDFGLNTDGGYSLAFAKIPGNATSATDVDGGAIASGETKTGTLSPAIDTDLFQFEGSAGDRVLITTANLSGSSQPDIYLYPPGGQPLEASHLTALSGHFLEWELQQTGTYTILVSDNGLNTVGSYSISLAKIPGAATSAADSDGGTIASGETKLGYLANRSDTDIFQFAGEAGSLVILTVAENTGNLEPVIRVYPPSGPAEVTALDAKGSQWIEHLLLQSGTYTVVVSDYNLDEEGWYALALAKIPGAVTSTDDTDGGTIMSGGTKAGAVSYQADTDLFLFDGTAGNTIVVTAAALSGGLEPEIRLYAPGGGLEQSALPPTTTTRQEWQLQQTGVYTVVLSDGGLDESGGYAFSLVQVPGGISPSDDPNDNDGGLLVHAESKVGAFHYGADQDVYHFYGRPGDRVTLTAAPYASSVQPEIYLYPPGGGAPEKIATGSLMPQRLTHTLLKKGLYTFVVSDNGLNSTGYYSVLFSTSAAPPVPGIYNSYPPNGSTVVSTEKKFLWDAVPRATGYELYFGTDPLLPLDLLGTFTAAGRRFPERVVGKPYYWRVVALTPAGKVYGPLNWFTFMSKPVIHRDDFTDGSEAGDPDWAPYRYASWKVNGAKQLYSTVNIDNRIFNRAFGSYLTGRIQTRVMLAGPSTSANASLLFSYQSDHQRYRYVKLAPGKVSIGQVGLMGSEGGGIKKTIPLPTVTNKWYTLRADLDSMGTVKVYLDGVLKGSFKFRKAIPGWLGYGADRVESFFDNFYCQEATVYP